MKDHISDVISRCKGFGDLCSVKEREAVTNSVERVKSQWNAKPEERAASAIRAGYIQHKKILTAYTKEVEQLVLWSRIQRSHIGTVFGQAVDTAFKRWVVNPNTIKVREGNKLCLLNVRYVTAALTSHDIMVTHSDVAVYSRTGNVYGRCDGVGYHSRHGAVVLVELKTRYSRTMAQHDIEWAMGYPVRHRYQMQALGLSRMLEESGGLGHKTVKTCVVVTCIDGCRLYWIKPSDCAFNQEGRYWKCKKGAPPKSASGMIGAARKKRKTLTGVEFLSYNEVEYRIKLDTHLLRVISKFGYTKSSRDTFRDVWKRGAGGQKLVAKVSVGKGADFAIKVARITHANVTAHDILREVRNQKVSAIVYAYKHTECVWRIMRVS